MNIKHQYIARTLVICAAAAFSSTAVVAERVWHDHAIRLYGGYVENAATVDARDTYMKLRMGSAAEFGAAFGTVVNKHADIDIALSHLRASGTQRNEPGSGNEKNTQDIRMGLTQLRLTGKFYYDRHERMFMPWLGGGINAGLIDCNLKENVHGEGGYIHRERRQISSNIGLHVSLGADLYPIRTGALAFTLETRYHLDGVVNGPFKGNFNGFAFLFGAKWDFWPSTTYKFRP